MDINSLSHTKWNCKYHFVCAPKDASTIIATDIFAATRKRAVERNHQRLHHLTQPGRRPWLSQIRYSHNHRAGDLEK